MESSYGYSFIAHKKKYEKEKGIMFCIFPEVHCFARSSGSKRRDELHEKKFFYRGFNYFKITHSFQPRITTEAFIKKKE